MNLRRLLDLFGTFAFVALLAAAGLALWKVQQRLHVTLAVEEESASRQGAPLAEVAANVADLRNDLRALAAAIESAAGDRDLASRAEIAALNARFDQLERDLRDARRAAPGPERGADAVPPPDRAVVATPPPAAPKAPPGFLRFQLPSDSFVFSRRQQFAIVASLSRVGFDAKSTLHDFSGVTTKVAGELVVDLAHPDRSASGEIRVDTASLDTGLDARDEEMRALLAVADHPALRFAWKSFVADAVDEKAMQVRGSATGDLTIGAITRSVTMPVTVAVDASRRVTIDGQAKIRLTDFAIAPPRQLGVISVEDEITLWVALRARSLGPAEEPAHAQ